VSLGFSVPELANNMVINHLDTTKIETFLDDLISEACKIRMPTSAYKVIKNQVAIFQ
jgi:hypothetical protein